MRVLIAEDELISRHVLQTKLMEWGYDVVVAKDGGEAWNLFQQDDAPSLAILDWTMPVMDGIKVCRKVHELGKIPPPYIIILTARGGKENVIQGLQAGANDYITKPFDRNELHARLQVGESMVWLQSELARRVQELEEALAHVKQLQGLLPICSYCKKIRDDQNYWHQVEWYIKNHTDADFTHGICPDCYENKVKPELESLRRQKETS